MLLRTNTAAAPTDVFAVRSSPHPGGLTPVAGQSSSAVPMASVLPSALNATATPHESPPSAFSILMYACRLQVFPARVNTYAAPDPLRSASTGPLISLEAPSSS